MSISRVLTVGCLFLVVLSFSITGFAQQGPPAGAPPAGGQGQAPPGGGESRFDLIKKAVDLTADQVEKVQAVLKQSEEEVSALQKEMPTWNDESKAAIDKIWERETARMLEVLTADQKPKYETWIKSWLEERSRDSH